MSARDGWRATTPPASPAETVKDMATMAMRRSATTMDDPPPPADPVPNSRNSLD